MQEGALKQNALSSRDFRSLSFQILMTGVQESPPHVAFHLDRLAIISSFIDNRDSEPT